MRVLCLLLVITGVALANKLECYQCPNALQACTVQEAQTAFCNGNESKCTKQTLKSATDLTRAIRKCVLPDARNAIPCPADSNCDNCNSNLCNSAAKIGGRHLGIMCVTALLAFVLNKFIC